MLARTLIILVGYVSGSILASDSISLGAFCAKKHVINTYSNDLASSKSFFAVSTRPETDEKGKIITYDRRKKYVLYSKHDSNIGRRVDDSLTIIDDTYVVSATSDEKKLWISTIGDESGAKSIVLQDPLEHLAEASHKKNCVLGICDKKKLCVFDLATEKMAEAFTLANGIFTSVLPDKSGEGIWYARSQGFGLSTPNRNTLAHYDMRSDTTTMSAEVPAMIGRHNLSVNASDTRCAMSAGNKIYVYDVRAQKYDRPIAVSKEYSMGSSHFAEEDLLVYNVREGHSATLHMISLTLGDIEQATLPDYIDWVHYHSHTGLVIGSRHLMGFEVYDFGFKQ